MANKYEELKIKCQQLEHKVSVLENKKTKLEKALDMACEKLYDKGYNEQCKFKTCEATATFYEGDYDKKICSSCHKEYLLESEKD